jgi:hypothetical protein
MALGTVAPVAPWQNPVVEDFRDRFYGRYVGFVRNRDDPEKRGRILAHVPAIMPGPPSNEQYWLDWALPRGGALSVPPVGNPVWITFEHGQIQHPVYEWGPLRGENAEDSEAPVAGKGDQDPTWKEGETSYAAGQGPDFDASVEADTAISAPPTYGYNKVFESEGGQILEVDDSPDGARARFYHPSGTSLLIEPNGSVLIRAAGGVETTTDGDYVINLGQGSTFKVVYNDGTSIALGASGFHVKGHQATIIGRVIVKNGDGFV